MGIGAFIGLDNCYIRCAEAGPPEGFERSGHHATKAPIAVGIVIIWNVLLYTIYLSTISAVDETDQ